MTVSELKHIYGIKLYKTGVHEDLLSVCMRIYNSDDDKYRIILTDLNTRFDWEDIKPNSDIRYIPNIEGVNLTQRW